MSERRRVKMKRRRERYEVRDDVALNLTNDTMHHNLLVLFTLPAKQVFVMGGILTADYRQSCQHLMLGF